MTANANGHGQSARPGQAGKPVEIQHDGQGGRLLSRGCGFPSLGGSRFPSLAALFGFLRRLRFAAPSLRGSRFPSLAVFGLVWAAAAVCRSLARCGFPSLAVRRRPPWPWGCFFCAQCPLPLPAWPGLADRARLAASALRALRAPVAP